MLYTDLEITHICFCYRTGFFMLWVCSLLLLQEQAPVYVFFSFF